MAQKDQNSSPKRSLMQLSVQAAARYINLPERTIRHHLKTKKLVGHKVGKEWFIDRASVDAFAQRYGFVTGPLEPEEITPGDVLVQPESSPIRPIPTEADNTGKSAPKSGGEFIGPSGEPSSGKDAKKKDRQPRALFSLRVFQLSLAIFKQSSPFSDADFDRSDFSRSDREHPEHPEHPIEEGKTEARQAKNPLHDQRHVKFQGLQGRINTLKLEYFGLLGRGFYSFHYREKIWAYREARNRLAELTALYLVAEGTQALGLRLESEVLPALGALLRLTEKNAAMRSAAGPVGPGFGNAMNATTPVMMQAVPFATGYWPSPHSSPFYFGSGPDPIATNGG